MHQPREAPRLSQGAGACCAVLAEAALQGKLKAVLNRKLGKEVELV